MSYFSRLTDIVTCNLTEILAREADPQGAIQNIIDEMAEGLAGAQRSVSTAAKNEERLKNELTEHLEGTVRWTERAKEALAAGDETAARDALQRKQELEDVIAGLEQEHRAAVVTREHLTTTLRAIEARLAEARRKLALLQSGVSEEQAVAGKTGSPTASAGPDERADRLERELEELKKELGQG